MLSIVFAIPITIVYNYYYSHFQRKCNQVSKKNVYNNRVGEDLRKKIQELAYAKFREEKPVLALEEERLELVVLEGENYMGSFSMHSTNEFPLRGIVYSTNPRMKCLLSEFEGMRVTVPFEFHSEGLIEGDVQKGDFYIICDGGEYNLSFAVSMTRFYTQTSLGKIWNLFEFANLAQTSWTEAYRMFQAPFFTNIIKDTEIAEYRT